MTDVQSQIESELEAYYQQRASATDRAVRVGWRDGDAQRRRFEQLCKLLPADRAEAFSVADVGCGLGDFARFIDDAGYTNVRYTGYDRAPSMVASAAALYPKRRFLARDFAAGVPTVDFCIASGIFNSKFGVDDESWLQYVFETLSAMDEGSRRGFAFNALTVYSDVDRMTPDLFYADPCRLFDHCKRNFSRNVALLHDYGEYDFTILVRKAE